MLITRPEKSYRIWGVGVCDPRTSRSWPTLGSAPQKKKSNRTYEKAVVGPINFRTAKCLPVKLQKPVKI